MHKGVDCFPVRKKNFIDYCFRFLSVKKKLRKEMIEVHKSMTLCRDRSVASGMQLGKGSGDWLSRKGIVASVIEGVIWPTMVYREK